MKKDLLNSGAKLMAVLFLFFFSFTTSDLSAQTTDLSPGVNSLMHNGVRYDVDGLLSQYNYVSDVTASNVFLTESRNQSELTNSGTDDLAQIEASVKADFYKTLHYLIADGASVQNALRVGVYTLPDIVGGAYKPFDANTPRPDLIQLATEAVQLVAL